MNKETMLEKIQSFIVELEDNEKSQSTIATYRRVVGNFVESLPIDKQIEKSDIVVWKQGVIEKFKPSSAKLFITIVNKFLSFCEFGNIDHQQRSHLEVKQIRDQKNFTVNNIITNDETKRMIKYAKRLNYEDMALIILTLVDTGIRVHELKEFTVENLHQTTQIKIISKGKIRAITLPRDLKEKINDYVKANKIKSGYIFYSPADKNKVISRKTIDKRLKRIAGAARISLDKAHCHSFRHLFTKNMERAGYPAETIADVLGHSSVETTRRYMRKSDEEMKEIMNSVMSKRTKENRAK